MIVKELLCLFSDDVDFEICTHEGEEECVLLTSESRMKNVIARMEVLNRTIISIDTDCFGTLNITVKG